MGKTVWMGPPKSCSRIPQCDSWKLKSRATRYAPIKGQDFSSWMQASFEISETSLRRSNNESNPYKRKAMKWKRNSLCFQAIPWKAPMVITHEHRYSTSFFFLPFNNQKDAVSGSSTSSTPSKNGVRLTVEKLAEMLATVATKDDEAPKDSSSTKLRTTAQHALDGTSSYILFHIYLGNINKGTSLLHPCVGIKTVLKQNMKGDWELYTQSHDKKNVPKKLLDAVLKHLLLENTTDENKISINSHIRYLGSQARDESTRNCHTKHITAARSTYCSIYICWLDYESHHLTIDVFFFFVKDRGSC